MSKSRRITEILRHYWDAKTGNRPYPKESEISIEDLDDIWDSCFLVKVEGTPANPLFEYIYLGESLVQAYGEKPSERDICETLVYPLNNQLSEKFAEVYARSAPLEDDGEFTNSSNVPVKYRTIILPLGGDQGGISHIIGGMKWKSF